MVILVKSVIMVPVVTVLTISGETPTGETTSVTTSVVYQVQSGLLREMEFGGRGRMVSSVHVSHARVVIIVIVTVTKGYRTVLLMYKCLILISMYPYNHSLLSMTLWYIGNYLWSEGS